MCWGLSLSELQDEQPKDQIIALLLAWLEKNDKPAEIIFFIVSIQAKCFRLDKEIFKLTDGVLYKQTPDEDMDDLLLVVPGSLRESVLSLHHDLPTAGHQGIARTKSSLKMLVDLFTKWVESNVPLSQKLVHGLW